MKIKAKPKWLKKPLPKGAGYQQVRDLLSKSELHTVCQEANCPNMFECFSKNTSAFMILGSYCTRNCRFCNVAHGTPNEVDKDEPARMAKAAKKLNLKYVVVTSVTRDDLKDGGASHFAQAIDELKNNEPYPVIEVLIPDFKGDTDSLKKVISAKPDVLNHNIETVRALYPIVRPEADFKRSMNLLKNAKAMDSSILVKSGIMVGLGETLDQLERTFELLLEHDCDILTIGQYLQPTKSHLPVKKFYSPESFLQLEIIAKKIGFKKVAAGPFVRSSYQAKELFDT